MSATAIPLRATLAGEAKVGSCTRWRDGVSVLPGGFEPRVLGLKDFAESIHWVVSKRGAVLEVRDIRNPGTILIAPKDGDQVLAHFGSSTFRSYLSTIARTWRS
jgi:hypothetical protein